MVKITRRAAIVSTLSLASPALVSCENDSQIENLTFAHGVASGDPTQNSMILWTRLTAPTIVPIKGKWQISESPEFKRAAFKGKFTTNAERDYTVKIDAQGLKPGQIYYYRFKIGKTVSPTGRTKTLPAGTVNNARLAVASCTNYPFGFFNAYDHIAKNPDFDAVIHLGDYFYEYGREGYGGKTGAKIGREHQPAHEIISLADYRIRHAQYKTDASAQSMHAAHPMICIWDDHETANDSWKTGAENHNEGEGNWDDRRAGAMQAYYEWMPIRDPIPGQPREALFKTYNFGDLLTLVSIETRLTARNRPIDYAQYIPELQTREGIGNFVQNILGDPAREMMGTAQSNYVSSALKQSKDDGQKWRLIANQTIMARVNSPNLTDYKGKDFINEVAKSFPAIHDYIALSPLGLPLNLDSWDGYPAAREHFYQTLKDQGVQDIVVLTGDSHEFWANNLQAADGQFMGVELGTAGVTSPGTGAYFGEAGADYSRRLVEKNADIIYHNLEIHGYIDLTLDRSGGKVDFIGINTVLSPDYTASVVKTISLSSSENGVKFE
jgi:phosphodiesterase/alkaline phosphatase D-like protein